MNAHPDFALYDSHGRLTAIVEAKSRTNTSCKWAAMTRRNIVTRLNMDGVDFFLLVTPDRLYMWKDTGTEHSPFLPTHKADTTEEFAPYFKGADVIPERITVHAFELVVGAWLGDVMRSARRADESTDTLRKLVESGFDTAVRHGRIEYEALV